MSQRRSNRTQSDDNISDLENAIKECVRFIVCREGSKIPFKRAEIIKHLTTTCETPTSQVNKVIVEADKKLKKVYGYKLVQVEGKSGIQYIVVLNNECNSLPSTIMESRHRKLLTAALTHIFMTGGPVKEEEMWNFLSETGLLDENDHAGRKILTNTFTKQLYLVHSKIGEGDLARHVFEWGQRATEEVPKIFLLKKMAEVFDKSPEHWCEQYKEATIGVSS